MPFPARSSTECPASGGKASAAYPILPTGLPRIGSALTLMHGRPCRIARELDLWEREDGRDEGSGVAPERRRH